MKHAPPDWPKSRPAECVQNGLSLIMLLMNFVHVMKAVHVMEGNLESTDYKDPINNPLSRKTTLNILRGYLPASFFLCLYACIFLTILDSCSSYCSVIR
jgi:hypothetical protein